MDGGGGININAKVELGGFYQYRLYEVQKVNIWNPFYFRIRFSRHIISGDL